MITISIKRIRLVMNSGVSVLSLSFSLIYLSIYLSKREREREREREGERERERDANHTHTYKVIMLLRSQVNYICVSILLAVFLCHYSTFTPSTGHLKKRGSVAATFFKKKNQPS